MARSKYLESHALYPQLISEQPPKDLNLIVVIPSYKETHLTESLKSLLNTVLAEGSIEILVIINGTNEDSDQIKKINEESYAAALTLAKENRKKGLSIYPLFFPDLPNKQSGVGVARKIGLDEALRRFKMIGNDNGVLVCFDADSLVSSNYFESILNHFENRQPAGASIYFEHDCESLDIPEKERRAITEYELHLRYYIRFQKYIGLPYAFYTVGSSMAVRSGDYEDLYGMNKRKAGEDFYFLHKFIKKGPFIEINDTVVYPSSRSSDRVPFGTGRAILQMLDTKRAYKTYNPKSFSIIQRFLGLLSSFYSNTYFDDLLTTLNPDFVGYLKSIDLESKITEIKKNTSSFVQFEKRFYQWFDAFQLMKCLHHLRRINPDMDVLKASIQLLEKIEHPIKRKASLDILKIYRSMDRSE